MNSFTRFSIGVLRTELETAIKAVADKHNLIIGFEGSARFNPTEVTFAKLKAIPKAPPTLQTSFRDVSVAGNAVTRGADPYDTLESKEYLSLGYMHGLKKEWLGKRFKSPQGSVYTIVGLKSSYRKFPVIGVSARGTRYKFTPSAVKNGVIL
jgi:hypothetical protein